MSSVSQVIPSTGNSINLFRILADGSIVLNENLSYNSKSPFYQLELKACVSGGASGVGGLSVVAPAHRRPSLPTGLRGNVE